MLCMMNKYSKIIQEIYGEDGSLNYRRLLVVLIILLVDAAAYAQVQLTQTEAGQAFKAGDYEKALEQFNLLLDEYPEDSVLILRYIGLSYHRLEQYDKAIESYEKALEIDPQSAPVIFYLASTYFKTSNTNKARELFQNVINISPDSLYSGWAERYMQAIEQQETVYERPGGPRLYQVFLQVAPQLDFNVPEAPSSSASFSDDESFRFTEYASIGLRTKQLGNWFLGTDLSTYQSQNTKSELREFNLATFDVSPYINYTTTVLGKPFSPILRYNFNYALLDYDSYSNSHSISATLNTALTENTLTVPFYRLRFDSFNDKGFDDSISSRDATNNALGFLQYFFFNQRAVNVWAGYEFQNNDADGLNFNYNGHRITAGISTPVIWGIRTDLSGEYGRDDYPDFQGPRDRETNRGSFFGRITRNIKGPVYGAFSYSYTNENSNYSVLEFDR
ncbi:MAG: tetratricopeptide repeat protein, partial [Thermodesulfobacteriota bacterium]